MNVSKSELFDLRNKMDKIAIDAQTAVSQINDLIAGATAAKHFDTIKNDAPIVSGEISICGIFRNNAAWLRNWFIPKMRELETKYELSYYFYENDSSDSTRQLLQDFVYGSEAQNINRRGRFKSDSRNPRTFKRDVSHERISNISDARNRLLSLRPFRGEWTMMIDSETFFPDDLIERFINLNIGTDTVAVSCNGVNRSRCKHHRNTGCRHYYDTLALIDQHGELGFNYTAKNGLSCCHLSDPKDREAWERGEAVPVQSAFGGCCFYRTGTINNPVHKYETKIEHKYRGRGKALWCEHWDFHKQLAKYGNILSHPQLKVSNEINIF